MENGDPNKQAVYLSDELYMLCREIADLLSRDGVDAALALEKAGMLLRLDEFCGIRDKLTAELAEGKVGALGFAAYLRRMKEHEHVDDWSTSQAKLAHHHGKARSDGLPVQMTIGRIA
jgi:hypothetical protein